VKPPDTSDLITQITRRQWLLRLGETVALAGVSGILPETPLPLFGAEQQSAALPPGLYEPSPDDLVHVLSSHKVSAPPTGSETDYVQPGVPYILQFFSAQDFQTVSSVVSTVLGEVDPKEAAQWVDLWFHSAEGVRNAARNLDPLHRALAVAYFGQASVTEIETADPAGVAREGLAALQQLCREKYHKRFAELTSPQRDDVVRGISTSASESTLRKFFDLVRNQAIRGYYTSSQGMKELDYKGNAYYPYCPGCESTDKS
jgi:Gluconate 2-dehydrogenase subunit 3